MKSKPKNERKVGYGWISIDTWNGKWHPSGSVTLWQSGTRKGFIKVKITPVRAKAGKEE